MRLFVLEGSNDVQFFKSFMTKVLGAKDVTNKNLELTLNFRRLLEKGDARVDVLELNGEIIVLLGVGGKSNFKIVSEAIYPLSRILKVSYVIFVGDVDAKDNVDDAIDLARKRLKNRVCSVSVDGFTYKGHLEDIVLSLYESTKSSINAEDIKTIDDLLKIISKYNDKYIKKRKLCCVKSVLSPRCFGHLFDNLFENSKDSELESFEELRTFRNFLP